MIGKILLKVSRKFSLSRLNSKIINANYIFDSSHFCSQLKLLHQKTFGRLIITSISSFSVCLHETMSDKTSRFQPVDARSLLLPLQLLFLSHQAFQPGSSTIAFST